MVKCPPSFCLVVNFAMMELLVQLLIDKNQISLLFLKAIPDPDFKYFSKLYALYLSVKAI
jgi:hypothetical protein